MMMYWYTLLGSKFEGTSNRSNRLIDWSWSSNRLGSNRTVVVLLTDCLTAASHVSTIERSVRGPVPPLNPITMVVLHYFQADWLTEPVNPTARAEHDSLLDHDLPADPAPPR